MMTLDSKSTGLCATCVPSTGSWPTLFPLMRSSTVAMSAVSAPVMSRVIAWTPVMMVSALTLSAFASVASALRCPLPPLPHKRCFLTPP